MKTSEPKPEEIKEIIRQKVKEVWIGRRSLDPINEQTNLLFDALYPLMQEYAEAHYKEKLRDELQAYDKWKYDNFYLITVHNKSEEEIINDYLKTKE